MTHSDVLSLDSKTVKIGKHCNFYNENSFYFTSQKGSIPRGKRNKPVRYVVN